MSFTSRHDVRRPQGECQLRFTASSGTSEPDPAKHPILSVTAEPGDGDPSPSGPDILRSPAAT